MRRFWQVEGKFAPPRAPVTKTAALLAPAGAELDHYGSHRHPHRSGDGLSLGPSVPGECPWWSPDYRVARGGLFEVPSPHARSSQRVNIGPSFINHGMGVRPARAIEAVARGR